MKLVPVLNVSPGLIQEIQEIWEDPIEVLEIWPHSLQLSQRGLQLQARETAEQVGGPGS